MPTRHALAKVAVPLLVVGTAVTTMLIRLGEPMRIIFDEVYYVNDARDFIERGVEEGFVVHPPLGKLLISRGIRIFGDSPFGWRVMGALAGIATVVLVFLIGRRLFRRTAPAAMAALLLAVDGVFVVQARTAMLDIYLAFFIVLGAWFLLLDRDRVAEQDDLVLAARAAAVEAWSVADTSVDLDDGSDATVEQVPTDDRLDDADTESPAEDSDPEPSSEPAADPAPTPAAPPLDTRVPDRDRRWLWLAGVAFGCAVAVKWSALLALGAAGLLFLGWELARRRRLSGSPVRRLPRLLALGVGALVVAPVVAYGLTWTPWFAAYDMTYQSTKTCDDPEDCNVTFPSRVADLGRFHKSMANFHLGLEADHPYRAPAYTWVVQARPVVFYYETCSSNRQDRVPKTDDETGEVTIPEPCVVSSGDSAEMLAVGNLALWWGFLAALPLLIFGALRRNRHASLPLLFYAVQFLPWLIVSRPVFSFYTVPIVPFMALGLASAVTTLLEGRPVLRVLGGAVSAAALGAAVVGMLQALDVMEPTRPTWFVVAGVGWALGGALAAPDADRDVTSERTAAVGRWILAGLTVVGVGLAIFFLPVWTGIELPTDVVKQRWWFRGWI